MAEHSRDEEYHRLLRLIQETTESIRELREGSQETDRQMAETDRRMAETDRLVKEVAAEIRDTGQQIRALEGLFGSQWGKFIEAMVQPNAIQLFRDRGVDVYYMFPRTKVQRNGQTMEIDLLLEDHNEVVVVEVKSTLKVENVDEFLADLDMFLHFFPRYSDYAIYAAVAGLTIEENADRYAYRRGLFVLTMSGDGTVQILNDDAFRPRNFGRATPTNGHGPD